MCYHRLDLFIKLSCASHILSEGQAKETIEVKFGKPDESATDAHNGEVESDREESEQYKVPYYVENFKLIVKSILEDSYYEDLFSEQDLETVAIFNNLSGKYIKILCSHFVTTYGESELKLSNSSSQIHSLCLTTIKYIIVLLHERNENCICR